MSDAAARGLSTGLKAKLAPLLRLQASDNDGERANASAATGRLLKQARPRLARSDRGAACRTDRRPRPNRSRHQSQAPRPGSARPAPLICRAISCWRCSISWKQNRRSCRSKAASFISSLRGRAVAANGASFRKTMGLAAGSASGDRGVTMSATADLRLQLRKNGYDPLPLIGKRRRRRNGRSGSTQAKAILRFGRRFIRTRPIPAF